MPVRAYGRLLEDLELAPLVPEPDIAVAVEGGTTLASTRVQPLTPTKRQIEVAQLYAYGNSHDDIARKLHVSVATVKGTLGQLRHRTGHYGSSNAGTVAAIAALVGAGYIEPPPMPVVAQHATHKATQATGVPAAAALTPRRRDVLGYIAAGLGNPEIARRLGVGHETVKTHVRDLLHILHARNRAHLVTRAHEMGYLR